MKQNSPWSLTVCFFAIILLAGCASSSPKNFVQNNDHVGLKTWYQTEAATLRGKAEVMRQMASEYRQSRTKSNSTSLVRHCENLVELYTKAAEDAEALAKVHTNRPLSGSGNTQPPENFKLFSF